MLRLYRDILCIAASCLALSACGGGSGGSSGGNGGVTPPPSGGSTNAAPSVSIRASDMSPLEGKTSTLDGSNSSDADGDTLSFRWTQLSGPTVVFSAATSAMTDITVPNLTEDRAARFQLQVSDGTTSSSDEVTLTLSNLVLTPAANTTIVSEKTVNYPNKIISIPTSINVLESLNYLVYDNGGRILMDLFGYGFEGHAGVITPEAIEANASIVSAIGTPSPFNIAWLAAFGETQVTFYEPLREPAEILSIDVDQPCSSVTEPGFSFGNILIGSASGDSILAAFTLDENSEPNGTTELASFGEGAAICEMQIVERAFDNKQVSLTGKRLLAFDQNTNEIIHYRLTRSDDNRIIGLTEIESAAIDLQLAEGETADFITSSQIGTQGLAGLALAFSNGETEGVHRLVIVGLNTDGAVLQETHSWDYGSPTSISTIPIDDHRGQTIFITTSDSPFAVIYKSADLFFSDSYLPLSDHAYFDLGVGHDEVGFLSGGSPLKTGLIASFPDDNIIKVFEQD